ncbi:ATP-binding protein [Streptomyces sp. NPDC047108]|uniref:ATP-binding protein n=1 Tax=Streptomyces sp. NPDC047108 TaxID=3155025 RepID=UPI0033D7FACF
MKPEITLPATRFSQRFSSTPRGARRARVSAVRQLAAWGWAHGGAASEAVALVVSELAANAVRHGRVPGRDFALGLTLAAGPDCPPLLRIELCDARDEKAPGPGAGSGCVDPYAESGRGLLLVAALTDRWGVEPRVPVGKTVWAELSLTGT